MPNKQIKISEILSEKVVTLMTNEPKKTPLYKSHVALGARIVDFAGWSMPVQYKGVKEEHIKTRTDVGLFDVSHMGEIRVLGPNSLKTLEWLTTNSVSKLQAGEAQYNLLPNEKGGLVDDIFIYCVEPSSNYLVCVNASNKDKDFEWMKANNKDADLIDQSSSYAQIAVQGPRAPELLKKVLKFPELKKNMHAPTQYQNGRAIIATTGYTGEIGAEIFIESHKGEALWNAFLDAGAEFGAVPVGLGARDTLRTEMKYSLYGHEIDDTTNPFEAGLGWVVKPATKDFIGKKPMMEAKEQGLKRKLVGFKMKDKGIPRQGYGLLDSNGVSIGIVTSGTHSPSLDEPIGIGYVALPHSAVGSSIMVDIRGRSVRAEVCETPFVRRP